jgi:thiol-disulfide isomerase/thioredoxin
MLGRGYWWRMRSLAVLCIVIRALASISNAEEAAGSAWSRLLELENKLKEKVPAGINAVEFYGGRQKALHDAAAAFVKRFPNDTHKPQAMLWKIQASDFPESPEQRIALLRQNEMDARLIVDDTASPADLRFQIQRTILDQWLDNSDLITTPDQAADLEARMADLVSKNPTGPQVISLQLARANLMLRFDHKEGLALLEELAKAPDQNLAVAAKARLLKAQMIGRPVDLQFTALDGSFFDMQALRGKVVLVDFWASWCPDCIREMPAVRQTYQKYKDKGFAVVGISLDKDAQALSNFVARKLIPWPQYFDGEAWENELVSKYGVRAIPEMWLINQRGEVVSTDLSVEQLDQRIEQLMSSGDHLSRK